jgi:site-specific DNA recombinase
MSRRSVASLGRQAPVGEQTAKRVRCAIYTRKSTEEGLDQDFNSLDAQREAAEAYIASQKAEGWVCVPDRYDDGGYSGGNMERPALVQLLADASAGKFDCVVVYKVDRLSRSLTDFARIMETFDRNKVAFVSVTQQFNTTSSMGRLTLNILLSFAQFEREIIGERIRDKLGAMRRKGKWAGGVPVLGYDVDRSGASPKLVVNAREAAQVREIFQLYLERGSLLPVATELRRRGWSCKQRTTRSGVVVGGKPFDRCSLHALLTNPMLVGKVIYKGQTYDAEHEAIVPLDLWDRAQQLLRLNGCSGGPEVRNKYGALLRGVLRCKACDSAMSHTFSTRKNGKSHRYYRCVRAMKQGRSVCHGSTLPALEVERVVVDEVRSLAADRELVRRTIAAVRGARGDELSALEREAHDLRAELKRHERELRELAGRGQAKGRAHELAALNDALRRIPLRLEQIAQQMAHLRGSHISEHATRSALQSFDALWASLIPREQARVIALFFERIDWDASSSNLSFTVRPRHQPSTQEDAA